LAVEFEAQVKAQYSDQAARDLAKQQALTELRSYLSDPKIAIQEILEYRLKRYSKMKIIETDLKLVPLTDLQSRQEDHWAISFCDSGDILPFALEGFIKAEDGIIRKVSFAPYQFVRATTLRYIGEVSLGEEITEHDKRGDRITAEDLVKAMAEGQMSESLMKLAIYDQATALKLATQVSDRWRRGKDNSSIFPPEPLTSCRTRFRLNAK
jgi:hypothetical protein